MSVTPSRNLYLYLKTVEIAMEDKIVTDDEATILYVLSNALGISPADTAECLSIARGDEKNPFDEISEIILATTWRCYDISECLNRCLDDELFRKMSGQCSMSYGKL